jgi:hypothetical protein
MISESTFIYWLPEIILLIGAFFWLLGNIVDSSVDPEKQNGGKGLKIISTILILIYLVYSFYRRWLK